MPEQHYITETAAGMKRSQTNSIVLLNGNTHTSTYTQTHTDTQEGEREGGTERKRRSKVLGRSSCRADLDLVHEGSAAVEVTPEGADVLGSELDEVWGGGKVDVQARPAAPGAITHLITW